MAFTTGTVDQELLLRNEYLAAEKRILRDQLKGRLSLSDAERARLAKIDHRLGRKTLAEVARDRQASGAGSLSRCRERGIGSNR